MAVQSLDHPDPARLDAFGRGTLDHDEMAEVERHLAVCESCCQVLSTLPADEFVGLMRKAQNHSDPGHESPVHCQVELDAGGNPRRTGFRGSFIVCPA